MTDSDPTGAAPANRRPSDQLAPLLAGRYTDALRVGDPRGAEMVVQEALDAGMGASAIHSRVIGPAMWRIGELWQQNLVSVADEHLATAISYGALGRLFPTLLRTESRSRERVMLAAAQGEHHVLGLRMVGDVLEGAGFDVLYLGGDVPTDALLGACRAHDPAVLALSVTMPANVPALIRAVEAVCALDRPPAILVAGRASPLLIEMGLGVPAITSSEDVVSVVEHLIAHPPTGVIVPAELALLVPPETPTDGISTEAASSVEDGFSQTALASSEAVRDASRHAFAMEQLAYRDPLTGLWNRRAYDDRFDELTSHGEIEAAVLMVDVDEFKRINDTFGHEAGDDVLVGVAQEMLKSVRAGDFVARLGGDEFAILLPDADLELAAALGERFRSSVERTMRDSAVTVSVGVARARASQRATSLAVDQALYDAKETGRNRVTISGG